MATSGFAALRACIGGMAGQIRSSLPLQIHDLLVVELVERPSSETRPARSILATWGLESSCYCVSTERKLRSRCMYIYILTYLHTFNQCCRTCHTHTHMPTAHERTPAEANCTFPSRFCLKHARDYLIHGTTDNTSANIVLGSGHAISRSTSACDNASYTIVVYAYLNSIPKPRLLSGSPARATRRMPAARRRGPSA